MLNAPVLMNVEAGAFVFLSGLSVEVLSHPCPKARMRRDGQQGYVIG
jgi:hypothetical protein